MLALRDRVAAFHAAFPQVEAHGGGLVCKPDATGGYDRVQGVWLGGQDYRNASGLYGSYPPYFLPRIFAMFPDAQRVLHLFSGSLTKEQVEDARARMAAQLEPKIRQGLFFRDFNAPAISPPSVLQLRFDNGRHPAAKAAKPDVIGDAEKLGEILSTLVRVDLIIADPPYRLADQRRYWRESMHAIEDRCGICNQHAALHRAVYSKTSKEGRLMKDFDGFAHEFRADGYVRFRPLKKKVVIEQCAQVLRPGGHLVWLDESWPMHNKETQFRTVGVIAIVRSTNHRVRAAFILERV